jgi:hypothetical protein
MSQLLAALLRVQHKTLRRSCFAKSIVISLIPRRKQDGQSLGVIPPRYRAGKDGK